MRLAPAAAVVVACCLTTAVACTDALAPTAAAPQLRRPMLNVAPQQVCSAASLAIPTYGAADPYPSTLDVSGLGASISSMTATVRGLQHDFPNDLRILLVGPTGESVFLMGRTGGGDDITGVNFTFDDAAASQLPDGGPLASGTYLPTNRSPLHTMAAPAPAGPYGTSFAGFAGTNPNGTWQLWVEDWGGEDGGNVDGGWCLDFITNAVFDFSGFFQPVDPAPTLNRAKAGSAIPLKFSLAGDQGLAILAAGSPVSQPMSCTASAPVDPVEETVTAGGSSLTYSALADRYTYVWKTEKSWAGTCRRLTMKLVDGSEHTAEFHFTK